jgi:hypothetical protein
MALVLSWLAKVLDHGLLRPSPISGGVVLVLLLAAGQLASLGPLRRLRPWGLLSQQASADPRLAWRWVTAPWLHARTLEALLNGLLLLLSLPGGNGFGFWFWLLPLAIGQPLLRFVLLAEHGGCPFVTDGLRNTRTTYTLAPLRWLMWNMPFHAEHHLYPSLPFHALAAAHRDLGPSLSVVAPGYLAVHRGFLANLAALAMPAPVAAGVSPAVPGSLLS